MSAEHSEERQMADRFSSYADAVAAAAFVNALAFFVAIATVFLALWTLGDPTCLA